MGPIDEATRVAELENDNRRLRLMLEDRGSPGELRHRARNTLGVLRAIVRKSAQSRADLSDYVAHLEDRLGAIARAQASADAHGSLDLHTVVADELVYYTISEGKRLSLTGPVVRFQPRAGQIFALAVHELAVNAVEHGAISSSGRLDIAWAVSPGVAGDLLAFTWKEGGLSGVGQPGREGFGTEVLVRMLAYELKAETTLTFEPDGLRCEIRMPLADHVVEVTDT